MKVPDKWHKKRGNPGRDSYTIIDAVKKCACLGKIQGRRSSDYFLNKRPEATQGFRTLKSRFYNQLKVLDKAEKFKRLIVFFFFSSMNLSRHKALDSTLTQSLKNYCATIFHILKHVFCGVSFFCGGLRGLSLTQLPSPRDPSARAGSNNNLGKPQQEPSRPGSDCQAAATCVQHVDASPVPDAEI